MKNDWKGNFIKEYNIKEIPLNLPLTKGEGRQESTTAKRFQLSYPPLAKGRCFFLSSMFTSMKNHMKILISTFILILIGHSVLYSSIKCLTNSINTTSKGLTIEYILKNEDTADVYIPITKIICGINKRADDCHIGFPLDTFYIHRICMYPKEAKKFRRQYIDEKYEMGPKQFLFPKFIKIPYNRNVKLQILIELKIQTSLVKKQEYEFESRLNYCSQSDIYSLKNIIKSEVEIIEQDNVQLESEPSLNAENIILEVYSFKDFETKIFVSNSILEQVSDILKAKSIKCQ